MTDIIKTFPPLSLLRSKSYSQFWEDRLLARLVSDRIGSYVDIGAGNPVWGSNTYLFYKRGWNGITIDPILSNFRMQKLIRSRDYQIRALVSDSLAEMEFFQLRPWELSTTLNETAQSRISNGAHLVSINKIKTITLSEIYQMQSVLRPAILSIDVEGAELEVLKSNNWNLYQPDLICIEELNRPIQNSEIREFLEAQNYRLQVYNGVSSIYVWVNSTCIEI